MISFNCQYGTILNSLPGKRGAERHIYEDIWKDYFDFVY